MADSLLSIFAPPLRDKTQSSWNDRLSRLEKGKESWELFWEEARHDPEALLAQSETGRNIAHLATLQNREEVLPVLPLFLARKKDLKGITPLDIAHFLGRESFCMAWHKGVSSFLQDPLLEIVSRERFDSLGIEWLSFPRFSNLKHFDHLVDATAKAKETDSIAAEKIWMGIYYEKEIVEGLHPALSIRWIDDRIGFGLFAGQKIAPCTFVGEYTGMVMERKPSFLKGRTYCLRYPSWGRDQYTLDAERKGNFTRFINHSDRPNLSLQSVYCRGLPRMVFLTLKEIPKGAQLTFDYGASFWRELKKVPEPL